MTLNKIGFGGGCHWCTESVFSVLKGVNQVDQGWIKSTPPNEEYSEAVMIHYDTSISLEVLIEIHLLTHASTSNHSMRQKYRSAIYTYSENQATECLKVLDQLKGNFKEPLITKVMPFASFKASEEKYQDYYLKNKGKPFCVTHIDPKLGILMQKFKDQVKSDFAKTLHTE